MSEFLVNFRRKLGKNLGENFVEMVKIKIFACF